MHWILLFAIWFIHCIGLFHTETWQTWCVVFFSLHFLKNVRGINMDHYFVLFLFLFTSFSLQEMRRGLSASSHQLFLPFRVLTLFFECTGERNFKIKLLYTGKRPNRQANARKEKFYFSQQGALCKLFCVTRSLCKLFFWKHGFPARNQHGPLFVATKYQKNQKLLFCHCNSF